MQNLVLSIEKPMHCKSMNMQTLQNLSTNIAKLPAYPYIPTAYPYIAKLTIAKLPAQH